MRTVDCMSVRLSMPKRRQIYVKLSSTISVQTLIQNCLFTTNQQLQTSKRCYLVNCKIHEHLWCKIEEDKTEKRLSITKILADILSEIFYAVSFTAGFTPGELQYLVRAEEENLSPKSFNSFSCPSSSSKTTPLKRQFLFETLSMSCLKDRTKSYLQTTGI